MSFSFGGSEKKTKQQQTSQTDPWEPTIPLLQGVLGQLGGMAGSIGPTTDQKTAIESLKSKAAAGNPWGDDIAGLTDDMFGTASRSGQVDEAYKTLQNQIGGVAAGNNLDPNNNPFIAQMLATVGDDIANRTKQMFAGSGRSITGNAAGMKALGQGVAAGQTPILAQFFDQEQSRQIDAAKALYGAGTGAATTAQGLDKDALGTRAGGIDTANAFLQARDAPENTILNLEQQLKSMPFEDMSLFLSNLLPIAGLGNQSQGEGTSTTKGTQWGVKGGMGDVASIGKALLALSDERAKEDIEPVGKLEDGQTVYRFRYKGDPKVHIGLIAQEVERVRPEAVVEIGGLKHVDYGAATGG